MSEKVSSLISSLEPKLRYASANLPAAGLWVPRKKVLDSPELQRHELILCARYPLFYYLRWVITQDEVDGQEKLFPNYAHLHWMSDTIEREARFACKKSRGMQATWITIGAKGSHQYMFRDNTRTMIQSTGAETVEFLIKDRLQFVVKRLPSFFFRGFIFRPKNEYLGTSCNSPWGAHIQGLPENEEGIKGAGYTISLWLCDEAALQSYLRKSFTSILPAMRGAGKAIIISSVRPGDFNDLCDDLDGDKGKKPGKLYEHEVMRGVKEWRNNSNGWFVGELHYSSDPHKDPETNEGAIWYANERKDKSDPMWNQEYEIDASAMASTKIYPQFDTEVHILHDWTLKDIDPDWTRYMKLDPGIGVPTAALWYAVSPEGCVYFYDEYYHAGRDVKSNSEALKEQERTHPGEPWDRKMDPAGFKRQFNGMTCAAMYADEKLFFGKANNDLWAGIEVVRLYLENSKRSDDNPMRCYILPHLKNLIWELKRYVLKEKKDEPRKENDHLCDCMRYALVEYPSWVSPKQIGRITKQYRDPLTGYMYEYESEED